MTAEASLRAEAVRADGATPLDARVSMAGGRFRFACFWEDSLDRLRAMIRCSVEERDLHHTRIA
jgi:hypothetical protein